MFVDVHVRVASVGAPLAWSQTSLLDDAAYVMALQSKLDWLSSLVLYTDDHETLQAAFGTSKSEEELRQLAHEVDVNVQDPDGRSLLHAAVDAGDVSAVRVLLELGADVAAKTGTDQDTPFITAVRSRRYRKEAVVALVKAGAPVAYENRDQHTALDWASMVGLEDAVSVLLDAGADQPEGAVFSAATYAVLNNRTGVLEILLDRGVSPEQLEDLASWAEDANTSEGVRAKVQAARGGDDGADRP